MLKTSRPVYSKNENVELLQVAKFLICLTNCCWMVSDINILDVEIGLSNRNVNLDQT